MTRARRLLLGAAALSALAASCRFDRAERWLNVSAGDSTCVVGTRRCHAGVEECVETAAGTAWKIVDDCGARGAVCEGSPARCVACSPGAFQCDGKGNVVACRADGSGWDVHDACKVDQGVTCRGGGCRNLCADAHDVKSNVGCEYWAVDLDNAYLGPTSNAAGQQYAIVVSNPQPDVETHVTVMQDDSAPGEPNAPTVVATATIPARSLQVFKLGPREVDGSPEGEFDTGPGTALTRHAYRVTSDFPVVAFQFNPLDNVSVFSNDASLLKPTSALDQGTSGGEPVPAYVAVGWPQTIAHTDDPNTNFSATDPVALKVFLAIVGTRGGTKVRVRPTARVIPGGAIPATDAGGVIEATLGAYDVLNLEANDFGADFTGTIVEANAPVAVFSGSEASDSPHFTTLADRRCCADHLEHQLDPIRTAGKTFALAHGPSRTRAVKDAGGGIAAVPEPDYFRIVAVSDQAIHVKTTRPPPDDAFDLSGRGAFRDVATDTDFLLEADAAIVVANVSPSQDAAGVRRGLPGGDPSLMIVPPIEQWRDDYIFLTPDKYAFDFVTVIVPRGVVARLDGDAIDDQRCIATPGDGLTALERGSDEPAFTVYTCQLSFPVIYPEDAPVLPNTGAGRPGAGSGGSGGAGGSGGGHGVVDPGNQNDGVHRVTSDGGGVGVLVSGFDSYVSYGYAAGTQLQELHLQ